MFFFRSAAEAAFEVGIAGLLEEVPGGKLFLKWGGAFVRIYRGKVKDAQIHADVVAVAKSTFEKAAADARQAIAEVVAEKHLPPPTPEQAAAIELWLGGAADATRTSLKRKDDPTGTSLPWAFEFTTADDALRLVPPRPPRVMTGAALDGLPGWAVDRLLGVGGFGEVWLARKGKLARASKFGDVRHEGDVIERVQAAGPHDHIVPLLDYHLDGDAPYLMYEYVPGGTLTDHVHGLQQLDPADRHPAVLDVFGQLAAAAEHVHTLPEPVVHRDLKPANVLRDARGRVRVTDFGIGGAAARQALLLDSRGGMTSGGRLQASLRGSHTPLYAGPEQKAGAAPDPRDDVHALGVILYQLCTGRLDRAPGAHFGREMAAAGAPPEVAALVGDCVDEAHRRPKDGAELVKRVKALGRAGGGPAPIIPSPLEGEGGTSRRDVTGEGTRTPAVPKAPVAPPGRKAGDEVHFPLPHGLKMAFCWVPPTTVPCQLGSGLAEQNAVIEAVGSKPDWLPAESQAKRGTFTTKGFWLGKYPVTQAEWHALTGDSPSYFQAGGGGAAKVKGLDTTRFPVENVTWDMCQTDFLAKLNDVGGVEAIFGKGAGQFVLPHEDQWEYAARGGHADGRPFYWGKELNGTQANTDGNYPFGTSAKGPYLERPTPVGSYASKASHLWGSCDLVGNVWEWCDNIYEQSNARVLRGGSWGNHGVNCRAASRFRSTPDSRDFNCGLRVLLPLD